MGLSFGHQELSRLVENLFSDLKVKFVFSFMEDLVMYVLSLVLIFVKSATVSSQHVSRSAGISSY
jgi:hypothetical protein